VPFPDEVLAHDEELSVLTPDSEATLWTAPDELEVAVLPAPLHATESVLAATARTKTNHLRERIPPVLTGSVTLATDAAERVSHHRKQPLPMVPMFASRLETDRSDGVSGSVERPGSSA
jgi:hypothetical protein